MMVDVGIDVLVFFKGMNKRVIAKSYDAWNPCRHRTSRYGVRLYDVSSSS